jgi:hypothetical protein
MGTYVNGIYIPADGEAGTVWRQPMDDNLTRLSELAVNVKAPQFAGGAVGDGTTDDTVAVQAAIDVVSGGTSGVPPVPVFFPPGTYRITSTLQMTRRGGILKGAGVGNPTNYSSQPGKGSTLRWDGAAAGVMINVQDSKYLGFEDILFQGNKTNVPAALIYFENAGGSAGTNENLFIRRCHFGSYPWTNPTTTGGTAATRGIRFGGTNGNNDQFHIEDCQFDDCATGIAIDNSQSIWGLLTNVGFLRCTTAGLDTSASITATNLTGGSNAIDMKIQSTARVVVNGYWTEGATQAAVLTGQGALMVDGGLVENNANMAGLNTFDHQSCGAATGNLSLRNVHLLANALTHPKIKVRGVASGTGRGVVSIVGCNGWNFADYDIANVNGDPLDVFIASSGISNGTFVYRTFTGTQSLVAYSQQPVVATASLPAAAAVMDGTILIEDNGTGDRNLIIYAGGQRFRIDGGAAF